MTAPTLRVEVGYGSTWQTEPGLIVWVDETANVLQRDRVTCQRGSTSARGDVVAGTASLALINNGRRFDPTYTAGPLYGLLKPGTPVRVMGTPVGTSGYVDIYTDIYAGTATEVPIWRGTIPSWPQRYDISDNHSWVPITAYDGVDKLSRARIPRSVLEVELLADGPVGFWALNETAGETMSDSSGNRRNGVYAPGTLGGSADRSGLRGITFDGDRRGVIDDASSAITDGPCTLEAIVCPTEHPDGVGSGYLYVAGRGLTVDVSALRVDYTADSWEAVGSVFDGTADNRAFSTDQPFNGELKHLAYRRPSSGASRLYVDGADATDTNATVTVTTTVGPGASIGMFKYTTGVELGLHGFAAAIAVFDSDIGAGRVAAHAAAALAPLSGQTADERVNWILTQLDWPDGLRNFETGQTLLGAASFKPGDIAWDYMCLLRASEDGRLFVDPEGRLTFRDRYFPYLDTTATVSQFTFTDREAGAAGTAGYSEFEMDLDDELLVNVARFTRRDGVEQVATNEASVATYGEAELQLTDLLQNTDPEVMSLAQWAVATKSTPLPRVPAIRVPLHRYTSTAQQQGVFALDIGHRVTIERRPQGVGAAVSLAFLVEGVKHTVGNGEWWVDLYVSPVPQSTVDLFILDSSLLDGTRILAY